MALRTLYVAEKDHLAQEHLVGDLAVSGRSALQSCSSSAC